MKAFVDSACDIKYASFYIEGLQKVLGKANVCFNSARFEQFRHNNFYLPLVIDTGNRAYRVVIDYADWPTIRPLPYEWCDLYCKINIAFDDAQMPKLFSIGPGFGIRVFGLIDSARYAVANLLLSGNRIGNKKRFLYDYYGQYKRPLSRDYRPETPRCGYVFFASSLWKNDLDTNRLRANFIRAARIVREVEFEGGFAPRALDDIPGFEEFTLEKRVETGEYIGKTKNSMAVFNTPAVARCHGWKLGEFMAMGKAIISTPISRLLPQELQDRQHLLITDGSVEDIAQKLVLLRDDEHLRQRLEQAAAEYYQTFLSPEAVIAGIIARLKTID